MSNILVISAPALRGRSNNLAEAVVATAGSGHRSFDICPRVYDSKGVQYLWTSLLRNSTIAEPGWDWKPPDLGRDVDLADAQALLNGALVLTPDMLESDPPDIAGRFVIAPNMSAQSVLAWLGLTTSTDDN
jgi:hypothetical protein